MKNSSDLEPLDVEQLRELTREPQQAAASLGQLMVTLREDDEEKCAFVADTLQNIKSVPQEWAPFLMQECQCPCLPVVTWSYRLLTRMDPMRSEYQTAVAAGLDHSNTSVQQEAAKCLGRMGTLSPEIVARLRTIAAEAKDPRLQRMAQSSLEHQAA